MANNPKLTVLHEMMRGKTFEIDKEVMSIGRRESMDICIPEASLSGHHADLIRNERDGKVVFTLRDNDSTNGTRVNDELITEKELKNSDLILFGTVEVLFDAKDTKASITRTAPTIDISKLDAGVIRQTTNLNPLAGKEEAKNSQLRIAFFIGLGIVGLAAVAMIIKMLMQLF